MGVFFARRCRYVASETLLSLLGGFCIEDPYDRRRAESQDVKVAHLEYASHYSLHWIVAFKPLRRPSYG